MISRQLVRILTAVLLFSLGSNSQSDERVWRFGFYWSPTSKSYPPQTVPWSKYTHISQIAIMPTATCSIDAQSYLADRVQANLVETAHNNNVKVLITLLQDKALSAIARCTSPERIAGFVAEVANYVVRNNYDGVDIDWEYGVLPAQYQDLVRKLRGALPKAILTADIAVHQRKFIAEVQGDLDRINLMNYDMNQTNYHGARLKSTWHQAALNATGDKINFKSGQANVEYLLSAKIDPSKINYGVPFYGYAISACEDGHDDGSNCDKPIRGPAQRVSSRGSKSTQIMYNQVVKFLATDGIQWDEDRKASYIQYRATKPPACQRSFCAKDSFVTFSDPQAMREAVNYLLSAQLGGVMTFALHQEYLGEQSGDDRYPLSTAINEGLARAGKL